MTITIEDIRKAVKEVLVEENAAGINPMIIPPLQEESIRFGDEVRDEPSISTSEAISCFFEIKRYSRLKDSTEKTNLKRLKPFAAKFEFLPLDSDTIRTQFLIYYTKLSRRYHRNVYDVLVDFYKTR